MNVTEIIEFTKKKVKIYLDGELAFALYKGELSTYNIKLNEQIGESDYETLVNEVLVKRAKLRAMNLLKSRSYTEQGIRQKLLDGCYPPSVIEKAVEYIKSYGYIDDLKYAKEFIRCYYITSSQKQIMFKLYNKGVLKDIIEQAFMECEEEGILLDEEDQILSYLKKKKVNLKECDFKQRQKLVSALYQKGYSYDNINQVMNTYFCLT